MSKQSKPALASTTVERAEPHPLILIVDDDADMRTLYREVLQGAGFVVIEASNGFVGVSMARERLPDAILLDYVMPVMDGLDAIARLKADRRTTAIPTMLMSCVTSDVLERAEPGVVCDRIADKCCSARTLIALVNDLLHRRAPDAHRWVARA